MVGETASLTWSSTAAHTCVIEPGIGAVDPSGCTAVFPAETTAYTITATGLAGKATAATTVTVLYLPTVSIFADPETFPPRF